MTTPNEQARAAALARVDYIEREFCRCGAENRRVMPNTWEFCGIHKQCGLLRADILRVAEALAQPASAPTAERNMAMLLRRWAHRFKDDPLAKLTVDYLRRTGNEGSPLRESEPVEATSAKVSEGAEPSETDTSQSRRPDSKGLDNPDKHGPASVAMPTAPTHSATPVEARELAEAADSYLRLMDRLNPEQYVNSIRIDVLRTILQRTALAAMVQMRRHLIKEAASICDVYGAPEWNMNTARHIKSKILAMGSAPLPEPSQTELERMLAEEVNRFAVDAAQDIRTNGTYRLERPAMNVIRNAVAEREAKAYERCRDAAIADNETLFPSEKSLSQGELDAACNAVNRLEEIFDQWAADLRQSVSGENPKSEGR